MTDQRISQEDKIKIIEAFVAEVEKRAEQTMAETHKLEGAHYAAMTFVMKQMKDGLKRGGFATSSWKNDTSSDPTKGWPRQ